MSEHSWHTVDSCAKRTQVWCTGTCDECKSSWYKCEHWSDSLHSQFARCTPMQPYAIQRSRNPNTHLCFHAARPTKGRGCGRDDGGVEVNRQDRGLGRGSTRRPHTSHGRGFLNTDGGMLKRRQESKRRVRGEEEGRGPEEKAECRVCVPEW